MKLSEKKASRRKALKYIGAGAIVAAAAAAGVYYTSTPPTPTAPTTTPTTSTTAPTTTVKPVSLTAYNISYQNDFFKQKFSDWNSTHPNVQATFQPLADYYTEIASILSSTPDKADIVRVNPGYMAPYAEAGWIVDLEDLPGLQDILAQVEPARRPELVYNGKTYSLPTSTGYMNLMLYNQKYLSQAGFDHPPATLNELVEQSKAIRDKGIVKYPLAFHLKPSERRIDWSWYNVAIWMGGKTLYDENWKPTYLDSKSPGYRSLQFITDCINQHKVTDIAAVEWDTFKVNDLLMKGDCAFIESDPFQMSTVHNPTKSPQAANIQIFQTPESHYTWVKSDAYSITQACKKKGVDYFNGAWEFLKWYAGPTKDSFTYAYAAQGFEEHTCYTSLNTDPALRQIWSGFADVNAIDEQVNHALSLQEFSPPHKTKFYLRWVNDYLLANLQDAVLQRKTVEAALNAIDQGFQSLAKQYGLPKR